MRASILFVVAGLMLATAAPAALAEQLPPDIIDGKYRGALSGANGETGGEFTVAIERDGDGFSMTWPPRIVARFEPAGRPGIFEAPGKKEILEGGPVYWARIEGETLIVYSAQIDEHGGYRIDSFVYSPSATGLDLVIRQVKAGAEPRTLRGRLARYAD